MKYFSILLFLFISFNTMAQTSNCKNVHTGTFKITMPESGTTIIKRTPKTQIEENEQLGIKVIFDVVWIDDCTYELRNTRMIKGKSPSDRFQNEILTCKIIEIKSNSYIVRASSNLSDYVMEAEVEISK